MRAGAGPQPLYVYNGGFLNARLRRILALAGWQIRTGRPGPDDWIGVWGASPTHGRGTSVAAATGAKILRIEDAFLRGLFPGRAGEPPLGLFLDGSGVHFDPSVPSDLEKILLSPAVEDAAVIARSRDAIDRMQRQHVTKFAAVDPSVRPPGEDYVLVVDQARDDASVTASGAGPETFARMLRSARADHPDARIVIKAHPETPQGFRNGYFVPEDGDVFLREPISPWRLLKGARAVFTVSSQLGFEAILAGHRPVVFGQPFYGGWGLSHDDDPLPRRAPQRTAEQLFAGAMILAPTWYDPFHDRLCALEEVLDTLEAQARVWREDRQGYWASGISTWKRPHMRAFFGRHAPVTFTKTQKNGAVPMVWGDRPGPEGAVRVEDGFLRSRGLGALLTPPLSLPCDRTGLACDASGPSDLEAMIAAAPNLPPSALRRAERLIATLRDTGLSKYGSAAAALPALPDGPRILVTGQVADDASVRLGCPGAAKSDDDVIAAARKAHPDATLIFKPHPDVLAGLRSGLTTHPLADVVLVEADPIATLAAVDEVWTLTSTLGFEALVRGVPVTCLGLPFYAGWNLTTDHAPVPERRGVNVSLAGLVHAALIDYPRYYDPVTGLPCPVEVAVTRLADPDFEHGATGFVQNVMKGLQSARGRLARR